MRSKALKEIYRWPGRGEYFESFLPRLEEHEIVGAEDVSLAIDGYVELLIGDVYLKKWKRLGFCEAEIQRVCLTVFEHVGLFSNEAVKYFISMVLKRVEKVGAIIPERKTTADWFQSKISSGIFSDQGQASAFLDKIADNSSELSGKRFVDRFKELVGVRVNHQRELSDEERLILEGVEEFYRQTPLRKKIKREVSVKRRQLKRLLQPRVVFETALEARRYKRYRTKYQDRLEPFLNSEIGSLLRTFGAVAWFCGEDKGGHSSPYKEICRGALNEFCTEEYFRYIRDQWGYTERAFEEFVEEAF